MPPNAIVVLISLTAAAAYARAAWRAGRSGAASQWTPLALALHAVALWQLVTGSGIIEIGVASALSILAWQSALLLWSFSLRERLHTLGVVPYAFAVVMNIADALLTPSAHAAPLQDWKIGVHVAFSILSAGMLTLAAVSAVAIAVLDQILRHPGNMALALRLPPLQTLETLLFRLIGVGFSLLSLTILSGLLFVHDLLGQHLAHKTILTFCAWAIFGILLLGRLRYGWRGRRALHWTLAGYATLIIAYFGSKLILEQFLGRHWS